jgi:hypothetical protein
MVRRARPCGPRRQGSAWRPCNRRSGTTPDLSAQFYAQPFVAAGDYTPDFNFKQLRSNLVLRWEYRPGSTLFVVWSHGRTRVDPTGSFDALGDLDRLLGASGQNAVAIKVSYWLDL